MSRYDVVVVGGGLRGMRATARARAERPDARVLCVEATPAPGDDVQSQRSNGFVCELGPFAYTREELDFWLEHLDAPPRVVSASDRARTGWLFDGDERRPLRVEPEPYSFPTGCEELVQGYRRQLGEALRLGRRVTSIAPQSDGGFALALGTSPPSELRAQQVVLAIPDVDAADILAPFEPELPQVAARAERAERAFVWFGGIADQAPELTGYGVLPHPSLQGSVAEMIFCTEVFDFLTLAALIDNTALCVHGGLSPDLRTIDRIRTLDRCCEIPHEGPFCDLMWSDPEDIDAWSISPRGAGWLFGSKVTAEFNRINGLNIICRAHQLVQEGLKYMFEEESLVTVWSAPNYCYRCGNQAALLLIDDKLELTPVQYDQPQQPPRQVEQHRSSAIKGKAGHGAIMMAPGVEPPQHGATRAASALLFEGGGKDAGGGDGAYFT